MEKLGINWKILIGQIINFAILFFLLQKFVFGRFADTLKKRRDKIEDGLRKAEEAEQNLARIRTLEREIKEMGDRAAKEVIREARLGAEKQKQEIILSAEKEKEKILAQGRERAELELEKEKDKQKEKTIEVSFLLAEKFLKEKLDKEEDKKLLEDLSLKLK